MTRGDSALDVERLPWELDPLPTEDFWSRFIGRSECDRGERCRPHHVTYFIAALLREWTEARKNPEREKA